jgi:hypothetical protein
MPLILALARGGPLNFCVRVSPPTPSTIPQNILELKQTEEDQQEAIGCYSNYESLALSLSSSTLVPHSSRKKARAEAKDTAAAQLRQDKSGDVTEDNHGKKIVSDNDKFFKALARENKTKTTAVAMMVAQRKLLNKEEAYDEYACYDGSTATMESCDDEECEEGLSRPINNAKYKDKAMDEEEFTNYTYERAMAY